MSKSLITDRKAQYSFSFLTIAVLICAGYYWYNYAAQDRNQSSRSSSNKNKNAELLFNQGNEFYRQGKMNEAIEKYHEVIKLEPTHEQAHISASLAAARLGDTDHALEHAQKALLINPNYVPGYVMVGKFQQDKKLFDDAKKSFQKALSFNANLYEGNIFMAQLLMKERNATSIDQALMHAQRAVRAQPKGRDSLMTLGDVYLIAGQPAAAREQYQAVLNLMPQDFQAQMSIGKTYEHEQLIEKAIPYYKKSIELNPNFALGHISLAGAHFMTGNLKEAFKEYEWRWAVSNMPNLQKKWDGSSCKGKTVVILSENGLGDIIQYVRFAQLVKAQGAQVIVHTHQALKPLFELCDYIDEVITPGQDVASYDVVTSMQSIPYVLGIDRATLPTAAYLKADQKLVEFWRQELAKDKNFKIGICWAPGDDSYLMLDEKRTIDLAALKSLADIKGVSFYCLQKGGTTQAQLAKAPFKIVNLGESIDTAHGAFMDTAALMKQMDLVISVDTSIAHLAGALGVPSWILLPYIADVRWMAKTNNSIWYPSLQLFRQPKAGDWQTPIAAIKQKLQAMVK